MLTYEKKYLMWKCNWFQCDWTTGNAFHNMSTYYPAFNLLKKPHLLFTPVEILTAAPAVHIVTSEFNYLFFLNLSLANIWCQNRLKTEGNSTNKYKAHIFVEDVRTFEPNEDVFKVTLYRNSQ